MPRNNWTEMRAGPLRLFFAGGELRYVRLGETEILRRVYVAVRDHLWRTVPPHISNTTSEMGSDSFRVGFDAAHRLDEIDFFWKGIITGDARGKITFTMDGEAQSDFRRNRIGICVLHPPRECAGRPCRIEHADGRVEAGVYPQFIAPHQPFRNIRAVTHEMSPGLSAEVRLTGEVFEMEDQRNWTDGSYKIYSTPLDLPFPVEVRKGEKISQSCTLTLQDEFLNRSALADVGQDGILSHDHGRGVLSHPSAPVPIEPVPASGGSVRGGSLPVEAGRTNNQCRISLDESAVTRLPDIGLGAASHGRPLSAREVRLLRLLNPSHLRVDLKPQQPGYAEALAQSANEARGLGAQLEVAIFLSDDAEQELRGLKREAGRLELPVVRWLVFHLDEKVTAEKWVRLARAILADDSAAARIGTGTNQYFTELNRQRPTAIEADLICYSINPQVHATDEDSLVESFEAQSATVESARQFVGDAPLAVTPITLRPRFNPHAANGEAGRESGTLPAALPSAVDVRQMSLFAAGWTLGSVKALAESGAESVTYYETTGWRGVMETEQGSPEPTLFPSSPGGVFPLWHVLADVGEFAGGEVIRTGSSEPLKVVGLALSRAERMRLMLANLSGEPQRVWIDRVERAARARRLNADNQSTAVSDPEKFRRQSSTPMSPARGGLDINLLTDEIVTLDFAEV